MNKKLIIMSLSIILMLFLISSVKSQPFSHSVVRQNWSNVYYPTSDECLFNNYNIYRSVNCNETTCPPQINYYNYSISGGYLADRCSCGYQSYVWYPNSTSQCLNSTDKSCPNAICEQYFTYPQICQCGYSSNYVMPNTPFVSSCYSKYDRPDLWNKNFTCPEFPKYWNETYNCSNDLDLNVSGWGIPNAMCDMGLDKSYFRQGDGTFNETPTDFYEMCVSWDTIVSVGMNTSYYYQKNLTIFRLISQLASAWTFWVNITIRDSNNTTIYFNSSAIYGNPPVFMVHNITLPPNDTYNITITYQLGSGATSHCFYFPSTHIRLWASYPVCTCYFHRYYNSYCGGEDLPMWILPNETYQMPSWAYSFKYEYRTVDRPTSCVYNKYYNATNPVCYGRQECSGCYQCGTQYTEYTYDVPNLIDTSIKAIDTNGNGIQNVMYKFYLLNKTSNTYYELDNNPIQNSTCYNKMQQVINCKTSYPTDVNGYALAYITNITSQTLENNLTYVIRMTYLNETHELYMRDNCSSGDILNTTFLNVWTSTDTDFCPHIRFNTTLIGNCTSNANCSDVCYNDYCLAYNGICNAGICTNYQTTCNYEWGKCVGNKFTCENDCVLNPLNQSLLFKNGRWDSVNKKCDYDIEVCQYGCSSDGKSCSCLENSLNCVDGENVYVCKNGKYEIQQTCPLGCNKGENKCREADISMCGRPCYENGWNSSLENTSNIIKVCDFNQYCMWERVGYDYDRNIPIYNASCITSFPCQLIQNAELGIGYCGCNSTSLCKVVNGTKVCEDYSGRYYQGKYIGVDYWKSMLEGLGSFGIFFSSLFILSLIAIILSAMVSYYSHSIPLGLSSLLVIMLCYFTLLPDLYPRWISLIIILAIALYLAKIISEQVRR